MIKKTIPLLVFLLFLSFPKPVLAHLVGQPPFLKVNTAYANLYLVPTTSLSDFELPQDGSPETYLVNSSIRFELDEQRLPAPPETIHKTKFSWSMGDGTKATGLIVNHTYTNPGSYFISINADDGSTPTPQLIESVLINVVPTANYQLPKAIIKINGELHADSLNNITEFPLNQPLTFDASASEAKSAPLATYRWDFGDSKSSPKNQEIHNYEGKVYQVYVVLRIKDQNGLISDNYVEVQDGNLAKNQPSPSPTSQPSFFQNKKLPLFIVGSMFGLFFIGLLYLKIK